MTSEIMAQHPVVLAPRLAEAFPNSELEFARYVYIPQQVNPGERELFRVPVQDVTPAWLFNTVSRLKPDQELALQSRVFGPQGEMVHVGMLDMAHGNGDPRPILRRGFGKKTANEFIFYRSGRSFHAYLLTAMSQKEWWQYMGRLLVCDKVRGPKIVDSRWVGHRLSEGYAALRWSCNTRQYHQYPQRHDF